MKCSKCNADITGMDSHICAGSAIAGTNTEHITEAGKMVQTGAIEFCINILCSIDFQIQQAEKRGWDMCLRRKVLNAYWDGDHMLPEYQSYDQAVQERDIGNT